jgi:hypothetical protein
VAESVKVLDAVAALSHLSHGVRYCITAGVQAFSMLSCASVLRCTSRVVPQIGLCAVVVDVVVVVVGGAVVSRTSCVVHSAACLLLFSTRLRCTSSIVNVLKYDLPILMRVMLQRLFSVSPVVA